MAQAREAGDVGMQRALTRAEQEVEAWGDLALQWIYQYAQKHPLFTSEECAAASVEWGLIQPPDARAWGPVYRRAMKLNYIERSDVPYWRVRGHAAPSLKWRSLVWNGK